MHTCKYIYIYIYIQIWQPPPQFCTQIHEAKFKKNTGKNTQLKLTKPGFMLYVYMYIYIYSYMSYIYIYEARSKLLTCGRFATYFESPLSFSSISIVFQGYRFFESPLSFAMVLCIFTISTKRRILNSTEVILTVLHICVCSSCLQFVIQCL